MDYLYGDIETTNRRLATPEWYTPYIKGHPMIRLGEFCKEFGLSMDIKYDTYTDVSTLCFRRYGVNGKTAARYEIPGDEINHHIYTIEDMTIKQLIDDFDIKEASLYMRIPRGSGKTFYKEIINARYGVRNDKPEIDKVIFSGPCTIVMWSDGDKTIVRCGEDDTFDKEKGLAMAISKKMLGNNKSKSNYYDIFKEYIQEKEEA